MKFIKYVQFRGRRIPALDNADPWVGIDSRVGDMIFIPCAVYFFWALLISIVDMNIERDML